MAREINYGSNINVSKGGARVTHAKSSQFDMAGDDMLQATQVIGTAAELISLGEIAGQPALVYIENLDTVNFVEIDQNADMARSQKLQPGRHTIVVDPKLALYGKADTLAVRIAVVAVEA